MTSKGQRTRAEIVKRSAGLMNRKGFLVASMAEVVQATGIQKGGLYRHFDSREALAFEAFDYAVAQVRGRLTEAMHGHHSACAQMLAMLDAYLDADCDVPFEGGCPIMNTSIEADHAHPALRARAQKAMHAWRAGVMSVVRAGQRAGEIRSNVDPAQVATVVIACIEGAVMLSHLFGDASHLVAVRAHLKRYFETELEEPGGNP